MIVKKCCLIAALGLACLMAAASQTIVFGFGDPELEISLNEINVYMRPELPEFYAEITMDWGVPAPQLMAVAYRLSPAELYFAAFVASASREPIERVVESYDRYRSGGWGELAKRFGIKPGSKEFMDFKDRTGKSKHRFKGKKR